MAKAFKEPPDPNLVVCTTCDGTKGTYKNCVVCKGTRKAHVSPTGFITWCCLEGKYWNSCADCYGTGFISVRIVELEKRCKELARENVKTLKTYQTQHSLDFDVIKKHQNDQHQSLGNVLTLIKSLEEQNASLRTMCLAMQQNQRLLVSNIASLNLKLTRLVDDQKRMIEYKHA